MGDPGKLRPSYNTPRKPWEKERIVAENKLVKAFGLKNKKEVWRADTYLRKVRHNARVLLGKNSEDRAYRETELLTSLKRRAFVSESATLDTILQLNIDDILDRRLQTRVWKAGLALTPKQSRQFIVHGHIAVAGKKVTSPGYIVLSNEETAVEFRGNPIELNLNKVDTKELEAKFAEIAPTDVEAPVTEVPVEAVVEETPSEGDTSGGE